MEKYKYIKVDAFTSDKSLGNPAACIYLENKQNLTDEDMLNIAKQHKGFVSEVIFCKKNMDFFDLVYFSSECEVNFCGHGTIACMYSLIQNNSQLLSEKEIYIQTRKKGRLTIYNSIPIHNSVYISAPKPIYLEMNLSKKTICDNIDLKDFDISNDYPIDLIDAGNKTLILPVKAFDTEINIFPSEQRLREFSLQNDIDVILIFCMDVQNKTHYAHTRVFAAKYGYLEDPATGSANAAFGYYMLKNNMWNGNIISLEQGGNDRVFNTVKLEIKDNILLFGGSATTRIEGVYYL